MDENLVGYLLDALEPETRAGVEDYLRDHSEARQRLELLRQALQPLECDRDAIEPEGPGPLANRFAQRRRAKHTR